MEDIAENLRKGLKQKLNLRNFYSLLADVSADSAVNEKQAFFVSTFNPKPVGSHKVSVKHNCFDLVVPETVNDEGIVNAIEESSKGIKINYLDKLVGFGSVGISVNCAFKHCIK